jgi:hypothetical protein
VSKRQREARRKTKAWIKEKRAAAAHVESVKRPDIESDVKALVEHTEAEGTPAEPDAAKAEEQESNFEAAKVSQQGPEIATGDGDVGDGAWGV